MFDNIKLLIPLSGIFFGTMMPILIVWLVLRYRAEQTQRQYDTAVKLAEKGHPVPPSLFSGNTPHSDLRRGLVLAMFGLGLAIALNQVDMPWTFGLIPVLMGVGYLIVWQFEKRDDSNMPKN